MSKDTNIVVLIGRLVRDPEMRYTSNGTAVVKFSIAVGEKFKQNNEWQDYTNFFDVTVWGNQAVNCEKYLKKGSQVNVSGSLKQTRWVDKTNNQNRAKVEVIANTIQFLSLQPTNDTGNKPAQKPATKQPQPNNQNDSVPDPWGDFETGGSSSYGDMPENVDHIGFDENPPF